MEEVMISDETELSMETCEHRLGNLRHWLEEDGLPPEVESQVREMIRRMEEHIALRVLSARLQPFMATGRNTVGEARAHVQKLVGEARRRSPGKSAEELASAFMAEHYPAELVEGRREYLRIREHYVKLFGQRPQ
jgi:hypothetical protein